MSGFDPDAWLANNHHSKPSGGFDPDAWLSTNAADPPAEPFHSPGALQLQRQGNGTFSMMPEQRTRAVFSDMPGQSFTPEQLGNIKEDTTNQRKAALVGGALQGATMGWGDEMGAAAGSLMGDGTYKDLRAENRAANKTAEAWSPGDFAAGKLAGGAATAFVPGLAPAGKLLTGANTLRAAAVGGAQALGESKADITEGDLGPAIADTAKGAAVGAGVNTGLGLLGAGYRAGKGYVEGLPAALAKSEDERLIDAATLGAPASQRDALMGSLGQDRPNVLQMIRANPEIEAALKKGDRETAAKLLLADKAKLDTRDADVTASLQKTFGPAQARPIIAKLEAQRDAAAAIPSAESQAKAAKAQKLIDLVQDKWMPAPPVPGPKGPELLAKLAEKADTGDKQRIGSNAESFLAVAEKHKLGEVANDPIAAEARIGDSLKQLGERREKLYDQVKEPLLITDVTRPLAKWRDELASNGATVDDATKVDALIKNIWKAHGQDGKLTMAPKEARALISGTQEKAFAGSYIDPGLAKEMQRKAAGVMKDALDQHVARTSQPAPDILKEAEKAIRKQQYPLMDPGVAETYMRTEAEGLAPNEVLGIRGDDYAPVSKFRNSRIHSDEWERQKGSMPKTLPGVSVIEVARDTASGPYVSARGTINFDKWGGGEPSPLRYGDRVFIIKGTMARGPEALDDFSREVVVRDHKIIGEIRVPGRAYTEDAATTSPGVSKVISRTPPETAQQLAELNKEYSALLTFKTAAEKRAAEARMVAPAPPETRTGTAPIADMRQLAATTEAPETRQLLRAGLHEQLPPAEAQRLAEMDRQQDLMSRLQAPLEHKAAREASPPTTLRHHAGNILHGIQTQAATGGGMLGLGLAASGHHLLGASAVLAGLSAKYGVAIGARAERALGAMVQARRMGATPEHLTTLGRAAGLTKEITHDLIGTVLPRMAASKVTNK